MNRNKWRSNNSAIYPDLLAANLAGAWLFGANFSGANLAGADLSKADLSGSFLMDANLTKANLTGANIIGANLTNANLTGTNSIGANFTAAYLISADLSGANLTGANLSAAILIKTVLDSAILQDCIVYGISAWNLSLIETRQSGLIITNPKEEPIITVDNLEIAQFIYMLLYNQKIRNIINTITTKVVLILGRFTDERKKILNKIREELPKYDYIPVIFDFDKPTTQDLTETVTTLAYMAKFIIADLTDPSSIPHELATIIPNRAIPVIPILQESNKEYSMFNDLLTKYQWVLPIFHYKDCDYLLNKFKSNILEPAEKKAKELTEMKGKQRD